jgi:hypothetical protein
MQKKIMILGIAILFIVVGFCGCFGNDSKSEENKFVGTWIPGTLTEGRSIIFSSNGNCDYLGDQAKWEIKDGKLVVNLTAINNELIFDYKFLDDNKTLELTELESGRVYDYKKQ